MLAKYCLERGKLFLEMSAELDVFRSLLQLPNDLPGTLVLGAGAFPGLSTHLLHAAPPNVSLEFRAEWSVMTGAGAATVDVMVNAMYAPSIHVEDAQFCESPPMNPIQTRTVGGTKRTVFPLSMPDLALAAHYGSPAVRFLASIRPHSPAFALRLASRLANHGFFSFGPVRWGIKNKLRVFRQIIFCRRPTAIRIELHTKDRMLAAIECPDAFKAGAVATAALAARWPAELNGLRLPHEGIGLDDLGSLLGDLAIIEHGELFQSPNVPVSC